MMCSRRGATAGEAGLGAHELQMMPVPQPKWFAKGRDKLRRSLRSCVDDGCVLVRRAALGQAIAVGLASRLGSVVCRNWFAFETVAVCDPRLAVAVALGSLASGISRVAAPWSPSASSFAAKAVSTAFASGVVSLFLSAIIRCA